MNNLPRFINGWYIVKNMAPICSVYVVSSSELDFTWLAVDSWEWDSMNMLFLLDLLCTANLDKNMPRKRHWSHMAALGISDRLQITDYNHWFLCQFTFENKIKIHQWSWPSYEVNANTMRTQWYQLCYNNRDIARPQIWRRLGCDEVSGVFFR